MMKSVLLLAFVVVMVAACARTRYETKIVNGPEKAPISVNVDWVKHKGKKFDAMASITNNTTKDIEIEASDFTCARAGNSGMVRHDFGSPSRPSMITLMGEQTRSAMVFCTTSAEGEGNITLKVDQVFEQNEDEDKRRVMGKNLAWEFAPVGSPQ